MQLVCVSVVVEKEQHRLWFRQLVAVNAPDFNHCERGVSGIELFFFDFFKLGIDRNGIKWHLMFYRK